MPGSNKNLKRLPLPVLSPGLPPPPGDIPASPDTPDMVIRPPEGNVLLPPGLVEEAFDLETLQGRVNLLTLLNDAVRSVNEGGKAGTNLIFILSGPVTYLYSSGGGISWSRVEEILIHPLNLHNIGFRDGEGCIGLNQPIREALIYYLRSAGLSLEAERTSSIILLHLPSYTPSTTRIRIYTPVEIGYSATLWDALNPGTSIYIGSPENLRSVMDKIAELPDKRAITADSFIKKADFLAASNKIEEAARHLIGAAQVMGNTRLRIEINRAFAEKRIEKDFLRYFREAENAKEQIDALWRFYEEGVVPARDAILKWPVQLRVSSHDLPLFIELARSISVMCIVCQSGEEGAILLDWNELGNRINEIGLENVPGFMTFFTGEETPANGLQHPDLSVRILDGKGNIRQYYFKEIPGRNED